MKPAGEELARNREAGTGTATPAPARGRGRPGFESANNEAARRFRSIVRSNRIDRSSKTPLWVQLKNILEKSIYSDLLPKGTRLPSEQVLCDAFALSRPVVRNALAALSAEGLVIKEPRRGMFVASHPPEVGFMTAAKGVFEDMSAKGHAVSVTTFDFGLHEANDVERRVFGLPAGHNVIRVLRVYRVDGAALTHTEISLPAHRLPGMEKLDIENRSIFDTINRHYGLKPQRADRWIKAAVALPPVAERMGVEPGTPLLRIESVAFDFDGNALEYYDAFYNPDVSPLHIATDPLDSVNVDDRLAISPDLGEDRDSVSGRRPRFRGL